MPDVTPETQVADDLDQRVESLLKQMEGAALKAADIAAEAEAQASAPDAPLPAPAPPEADLASQVDQLLADAALAAGDSPPTPRSIGSLDDELARLASDLIEGDFQAEAAAPPTTAPVRHAPRPPSAATPDPTLGEAPEIRHAPDARPPPAIPPPPPRTPARPLWRTIAAGAARFAAAVAGAIRAHAPTLLAFLEPAAFRLAVVISAPLRNRPALVRDAIGWIALGTTFWASCLFVYFLFIYQPAPPASTSAAVGLLDPSQPAPPDQTPHQTTPTEHKEEAPAHAASEAEGEKPAKAEPHKSALRRPDKGPLNRPAPRPAEKKAGGNGESGEH